MAQRIHDVVIVGSGAGGGTMAFALARAGCDVLVLEKGPRYTANDYLHDEIRTATHADLFVPAIADEPHVLVDHATGRRHLTDLGWIANCVGGGTVHMGGALYRFQPEDFRLRSRFGEFEAISDWPYAYEDLEPYYAAAERDLGICGLAGQHPFEAHRSTPYPMPPLRSHPLGADLADTCRSMGLHPFSTPRAMNSEPYDSRPECSGCQICAGHGCPTEARGSIQNTLLRHAEASERCEVRPNVIVTRLTVDNQGRADGCLYLDAKGREHRVAARVVCVSASAVESARLLLMSTSRYWPQGLANGSGLVGRFLQLHIGSGGRARFRRARRSPAATTFLGVSLMDYYFLPPGISAFPKGAVLRFDRPQRGPIAAAQAIAFEGGRVRWGQELKEQLRDQFEECLEVEFEAYQEFVPNDDTYVTLDDTTVDRWGLPVACMHIRSPEHHVAAGMWLRERGLDVLRAMSAEAIIPGSVGALSKVMVHGTCRAGDNESASVLDAFCRSHEVANLFVVDGSFLPTCGGVPSTLTIVANALRTADYVLELARRGEL